MGSAVERSIFRAIEVQHYLDDHPELLRLTCDFEWPAAGDCLQGFQVIEELGRGAAGRVYLCRETGIGHRQVVVKVARSSSYEAEVLGRLDHPNIVPVYSVVNDVERCVSYICMPFRGRSTLQDVVDRARRQGLPRTASGITDIATLWDMPPTTAGRNPSRPLDRRLLGASYVDGVLHLMVQISDALDYAHAAGVYHGDLKPSNILLSSEGTPLLIDFNLATDWRSDAGPRGGTLAYMPPEQLRDLCRPTQNDSPAYDSRSEVYSFGVLVFQLLTGRVPFLLELDATDPIAAASQLLDNQQTVQPALTSDNHCVNRGLEQLILECLAPEPDDRPQTMADVRSRLQAQLRPSARCRRLGRRRPFLATVVLGAAATGLLLAVLLVLLRPPYSERQFIDGRSLQQRHEYTAAVLRFTRALENKPDFRDALYERARSYLLAGDVSAALYDFDRAAISFKDPRSAAYVGYCFNRRGVPSAAITWYERTHQQGFESVGTHNNLGVSYLLGSAQFGRLDRLRKSQVHLERAAALDAKSLIVRANLVTLALVRFDEEPSFHVDSALPHLDVLRAALPTSPRVMDLSAQLYGALSLAHQEYVDRALLAIEASLHAGYGPTAQELAGNPRFAAVRRHPRFAALVAAAGTSKNSNTRETLPLFIDPVSGRE